MEFCNTVRGIITQAGLVDHEDSVPSFLRTWGCTLNGVPVWHADQMLRPGDVVRITTSTEQCDLVANWKIVPRWR